MINYLIFNGESTKDYGVFISGSGTFNAPARDVEKVAVPGRNGTLTIDNGRYEDIEITYPAFIGKQYRERVDAFRNFVLKDSGHHRLEDTYSPDEFRIARWSSDFINKPVEDLRAGEFEIKFECYPQRFLKSGEKAVEVSNNQVLRNPTNQLALPLLRAYGTGTITIAGTTIQITAADSYTDIDCELQEAYKDTMASDKNANLVLTSGSFPDLKPGDNTITFSGISKLVITPRWWKL